MHKLIKENPKSQKPEFKLFKFKNKMYNIIILIYEYANGFS